MKEWYKKSFDLDYLEVYSHRDEQDASRAIDFIIEHVPIEPGHQVLDLCCGNGRHCVLLSKLGYRCIGLDLSENLLKSAQEISCASSINIPLIRADMRHVPFRQAFDIVLNLFTSFGYFAEHSDNRQVIESVSDVLKSSGYFLLDYLNKEYTFANLVPKSTRTLSNGWHLTEERILVAGKNVIEKKITITKHKQTNHYTEILRVYDLAEIEQMLHGAGLDIIRTFGGFDATPYDRKSSKRLILLAQKK